MNCGWKIEQYDTKGHFFHPAGNCYILRNIFFRKIDLRFLWTAPYMMTALPATIHILKGRVFIFISFQPFFFYFIFSNLDLYCHSKFIKEVHRHPKPDLQEQSRGNEKTCPVIYWVLLFSSIGLLANTQFTKSWEIWIAADRTEDLQRNCRIQSLIASEQWERKS